MFAVGSTDVDQLADSLAVALNVVLDRRASMYWGEYRLWRTTDGELRVYPNHDPMYQQANDPPEEEFFEPDFRNYGVLVAVDGETKFTEAVQQTLAAVVDGVVLIRP